jgi:hypothetical protein
MLHKSSIATVGMQMLFETIPHEKQRYNTVGDWWIDSDGSWQIRVSKLSDWRYEFLVGFHEMLEMVWCVYKGIREEDVTAFDTKFEECRKQKLETANPSEREALKEMEPGDQPDAPYHFGHKVATMIEKLAAHVLGVDWNAYADEVARL